MRHNPIKEIEIQIEDLPWTAEEWIFPEVCLAFELDESSIDTMDRSQVNYWCSFISTAASLSVKQANRQDTAPKMLSVNGLKSLHEYVNSFECPTSILQELALHIKKHRSDKIFPYYGETTPEYMFAIAVTSLGQNQPSLFAKEQAE
jgi:hypothetical protein